MRSTAAAHPRGGDSPWQLLAGGDTDEGSGLAARRLSMAVGVGATFSLLAVTPTGEWSLRDLQVCVTGLALLGAAAALRPATPATVADWVTGGGAGLCAAAALASILMLVSQAGTEFSLSRGQWLLILGVLVVVVLVINHLVAELRLRVRLLHELARRDALTGLANRRSWDDELSRELERARRDGYPVCVAIIDLDRFKAFNDMRGHPEGDRLLQRSAAAWRQVMRRTDLLARYGGEEFAALFRNCRLEGAAAVVERLRLAVTDEQTCSAGLARWDGRETADSLVRRADEALYAAKVAGRDRIKIADPAPAARLVATEWTQVVRRLLDERSVVAAYQPIVHLGDGRTVGYEALARPNRERIDIGVERMFEAAQRVGLGRDLDWLCRRAALMGAHWIPPGQPVFINCGLAGLLDPLHRVDQMLLLLEAVERDPADVVLEITERELVGDLGRLRSVVDTYRREGFRFAIDDVGEGHSTLEVLAATTPEFVKVARSLVVGAVSRGPRSAVCALVAFAGEGGSLTVAEGIEDEEVARLMQDLGVDLAQGYLFGRPAMHRPQGAAPAWELRAGVTAAAG